MPPGVRARETGGVTPMLNFVLVMLVTTGVGVAITRLGVWNRQIRAAAAALGPVVVLVVVGVLAGCGSGGKTTTSTSASATASWADGLCGSLVTWQDNVKAAGSSLKQGSLSKASVQSAVDAVSSANARLKDELQALGKPPTPAAAKAKAAVQQLSESLKSNVAKIRDAISGVTSANDVPAVVSAVTAALTGMRDDFSSTSKKLQSLGGENEWKRGFGQSQACQQLTGH